MNKLVEICLSCHINFQIREEFKSFKKEFIKWKEILNPCCVQKCSKIQKVLVNFYRTWTSNFFNNFTIVNFHQDQILSLVWAQDYFCTAGFYTVVLLWGFYTVVFFGSFDNEITLFWFLKMFVPWQFLELYLLYAIINLNTLNKIS